MITKIITRISVFSIIGLVFNFFMIYKFMSVWMHPQAGDLELILNLIILMLFEFWMINTGLLVSITAGRSWKHWLMAVAFFSVYAFAYNTAVSDNFIFIIHCSIVVNRTLAALMNKDKTDVEKELKIAGFNFSLYMLLIIALLVCSAIIPKFGLTKDYLISENYNFNPKSDDLFNMPHVAMCFGALYYLILNFVEIKNIISNFKK